MLRETREPRRDSAPGTADASGATAPRPPLTSFPRCGSKRRAAAETLRGDSLATFAKGKPAYIAYVGGVSVSGGEHLKVGHRYEVTINLGDQEVTRTVKLQANTKESAVQRQLGY